QLAEPAQLPPDGDDRAVAAVLVESRHRRQRHERRRRLGFRVADAIVAVLVAVDARSWRRLTGPVAVAVLVVVRRHPVIADHRLRGADHEAPHERLYNMYEPFLSLLDLEVPVIGALNGHAIGGGFGLALVCDLRIGAEDAKYGANFVRLGLAPGMAISYLLPRLV